MTPFQRTLAMVAGHAIFWCWNVALVSLLTLGVGPIIVLEIVTAAWMGIVPVQIAMFAVSLVVIPVLALALGLWKLRSSGVQLLTLLYGVEIPLLMLGGVRVFAIHELSAPTLLTFGTIVIGMIGLLRALLNGPKETSALPQLGLHFSQLGYALCAFWWGAIAAIYSVGIGIQVLQDLPKNLYSFLRHGDWVVIPFFLFFLLTILVFLLCPIGMAAIAARSLQVVGRHTAERFSTPLTIGVSVAVVAAWAVTFGATSLQPQRNTFEMLESVQTDADRRAVLARLPEVRRGLLAARLGPDRLFEVDSEHIHDLYPYPLDVPVSMLWSALMAPFRYDEVTDYDVRNRGWLTSADVRRGTELYNATFDVDMRRAEGPALLAAARSTWSWQQAAADIFDIGEQRVWLESQSIEHHPHPGGMASVTIHDVYRNHTFEQAEIVFHFSLPEGAAVTGLSLSDGPDREGAFHHVVAPRGAAQEVYEAEVRRRVDPALLEQVGPRQYRLRAFPVQGREGRPDQLASLTGQGPAFHLWMDLVVPSKSVEGAWVTPLPQLSEVRNAYWTSDTERSHPTSNWTPDHLPGATAPGFQSAVIDGLEITAVPTTATAGSPRSMAVLIDGSRSMYALRDQVKHSLDTLRAKGIELEVWCTREAAVQRCHDFDAHEALYWGSTSLAAQVSSWHTGAALPVRVVLTDHGSYGLAGDPTAPSDLEISPTWLVHLDGFPAAYDDWLIDRVQRSGGGVAASIEEALQRMQNPDVVDGFHWKIESTEASDTDGPFRALAARQAVRMLDRGGSAELERLDQQHALAVGSSVVTNYSSMIVLVNDWQREALKKAEERDDRFDREATDQEFDDVSSVPEPGTWLLLLLGGGLLARSHSRPRSKVSRA